jgi:PBP1b-binding outer membrane lipoprotein LpoB
MTAKSSVAALFALIILTAGCGGQKPETSPNQGKAAGHAL